MSAVAEWAQLAALAAELQRSNSEASAALDRALAAVDARHAVAKYSPGLLRIAQAPEKPGS